MGPVLQINQQTISSEELLPLLHHYHLLDNLLREIIIDQAIAPLVCTDEDRAAFAAAKGDRPWLAQDLEHSPDALQQERALKLQHFKQQRWQAPLTSYFLERSSQLDRVIYSMIRVQNPGIADELYFRIQAGEQTFADVASRYSQGSEAETNGLVGPVELGAYHPSFAHILTHSPPGELMPPLQLDGYFVILRIEKRIPAQLNGAIAQRLLNELFEQWLQQEVSQYTANA